MNHCLHNIHHNSLGSNILVDKVYDANYMLDAVRSIKAEAVIPHKSQRKVQRDYDRELYKERNLIERMFNKLKCFRRVATRYDKLDIVYIAFVLLSGIFLWLKLASRLHIQSRCSSTPTL